MNSARRMCVLLGAALALTACGTTASPATSTRPLASSAEASQTAAVAASCDTLPIPFDPDNIDLTGAWAGDDDGIYYLRQLGSVVWWNGMSGRAGSPAHLGRGWNNVGRGEIDALQIQVEWADVPRGLVLGGGTLNLKIEDDGTGNVRIVKVSETGEGGFGNSVWTPCTPG